MNKNVEVPRTTVDEYVKKDKKRRELEDFRSRKQQEDEECLAITINFLNSIL